MRAPPRRRSRRAAGWAACAAAVVALAGTVPAGAEVRSGAEAPAGAAALVAAEAGAPASAGWSVRAAALPASATFQVPLAGHPDSTVRDARPARFRVEVPVLLVPGWFDTERDLAALRIRLLAAGWPPESVAAVTFQDATGSNLEHAREIEEAAAALREATGATDIDVVAHSMGGLATRVWLRGGGWARRIVFVASPHQGTWSAYLAWGDGAEEMRPGSDFLAALNQGPAVPPGSEALTIRTPLDTHIIPGENAVLAGVPDRVVCCPTHAGLLRDLEVFRVIRLFLADGVVAAESDR